MSATPGFGSPLQLPCYYENVSSIIRVLKPHSTLRVIAQHLTAQGFTTPAGKQFSRQSVANFIRSSSYKTN